MRNIKIFLFGVLTIVYGTVGHASEIQDESLQKTCNFQQQYCESLLDYSFSDPSLLQKALSPRTLEFERLEFLGDRVLGLAMAHLLYLRKPLARVDKLAKIFEEIVSKEILAEVYKTLDMSTHLISSEFYTVPSDQPIGKKTASDIVEALLGAVYIDNGMTAARECVERLFPGFFDFKQEEKLICSFSRSRRQISFEDLGVLQREISYHFKNPLLLQEAFIHSSANGGSFRKLAFLGNQLIAS